MRQLLWRQGRLLGAGKGRETTVRSIKNGQGEDCDNGKYQQRNLTPLAALIVWVHGLFLLFFLCKQDWGLLIGLSIQGSRVPVTTTWPHRPFMLLAHPNAREHAMAEALRLVTLLIMGLTVATAGVIVVLYG